MRNLSCAFCPTLVPIQRGTFEAGDEGEHLWPDWVNSVFRASGMAPKRYKFHTMIGERLTVRRKQAINYKQPVVCHKCNNEWMSELEQQSARLLPGSMTQSTALLVSEQDRRQLALWAVKNAVVLDHTHLIAQTRRVPFYSPRERFAIRQRSQVPPSVLINLFLSSAECLTFARATYSGSGPRTADKDLKNREVYSATFTYGHIGFQVVKFKFQKPKRGSGSPVVDAAPGWREHASSLWPVLSTPSPWPPKFGLDFKGIWQFAHQWVDHTPEIPQPVGIRR